MNINNLPAFSTLVLAGGLSRRMGGGDKALFRLNGRYLLEYILDALPAETKEICISCRPDSELHRYRQFGLPLVYDERERQAQGPLAGILAALKRIKTRHLLVVPCDTPLVQSQTLVQLLENHARTKAAISCLVSKQNMHVLHAVINQDLERNLEEVMAGGQRQVKAWYRQQNLQTFPVSDEQQLLNVNTPADLKVCAQLLSQADTEGVI